MEENEQSEVSESAKEERLDPIDTEPLVLTDRDIQVFKLIHEQRFLCHGQIKQAFWRDRSETANTCYRRLVRLKEVGYLKQPYCKRKNLGLYLVTEKALEELRSRGLDSGLSLFIPGPHWDRFVDHDMKVATIRLIFREMGFETWVSERTIREKQIPLKIPDGVLTAGGHKIAIEFENFLSKSKKRFKELFEEYKRSSEYYLVFIILYGDIKDWLLDFDYNPEQVWFTNYNHLVWRREKALFENRTASFTLQEIL